jgi:uncharacterized membrane protein
MQKTIAQHIVYVLAMISFLAAVACVIGIFTYQPTTQLDPIRASLMASTVFFAGVGIVLYVIGTARLKGILTLKE